MICSTQRFHNISIFLMWFNQGMLVTRQRKDSHCPQVIDSGESSFPVMMGSGFFFFGGCYLLPFYCHANKITHQPDFTIYFEANDFFDCSPVFSCQVY